MDWLTTLGMAMGSAWMSGINLYATVVTLGLLQRFKLVALPGDLGLVSDWWVIGVAGALYLIEFVADKIPAVDSVWDAIHTFIRVPAGAVLAASAFASFDPSVRLVAFLAGGGVALSSAWDKGGNPACSEHESRTGLEHCAQSPGRCHHNRIRDPYGFPSGRHPGSCRNLPASCDLARAEDRSCASRSSVASAGVVQSGR